MSVAPIQARVDEATAIDFRALTKAEILLHQLQAIEDWRELDADQRAEVLEVLHLARHTAGMLRLPAEKFSKAINALEALLEPKLAIAGAD